MSEKAPALPALDKLQRYSLTEAEQYLRVSRPTIYKLIAEGRIRTIKEGARRYVPGSEIARLSKRPQRPMQPQSPRRRAA